VPLLPDVLFVAVYSGIVVYPYLENLQFFTKTQARSLEGEWEKLEGASGAYPCRPQHIQCRVYA
jgi:hypothetical protein